MAYQSKSAKLLHSPYRFTHRIKATESKRVDYPNGMTGTEEVETWNRPAALYSTNMTSVASVEIYNAKFDTQFAIRKIADDPLDQLNFDTSKVFHIDDDKTKYTVKNIQRAVTPNGYHVITLTTNADSISSSSSSSDSGSYGY